MGDTPNPGETATQPSLENNNSQPTTPPVGEKKPDASEVEALRKKAEQAEMRANQLANELEAKKAAEAAAEAKKLEEKEEYKTLYEQEKAKNEAAQQERDAEARRKAVDETADSILSDYSDNVKDAAKDLGLNLNEVTDEAVATFKEKLEKLKTRIGNQRVTPNNPGTSSGQKEYTGEELRTILADPAKRDAYFRAKGGAAAVHMQPE